MRLRRVQLAAVVGLLVAATATGSAAVASGDGSGDGFSAIQVRMTGYEEDPSALSTPGVGFLRVRIGEDQISYRLSYANLEGAVAVAHIHFGGRSQSGGVAAFLCGGGPAGTPACPPAPATVSGTITAASVVGPAGQGIAAGEFGELLRAIRAGKTYANLHTSKYPGGEIRGQLGHH